MAELGSRWRYPMRRIGDAVGRLRDVDEESLTTQADRAWETAWIVAVELTRREEGLSLVDPTRVAADLEAARKRLAEVPDGSVDSVSAAAEVNTRESQFRAVHDVWNMVDDADAQLRTIASAIEDAAARVSGIGEVTTADVVAAEAGLTTVNADLDTLRLTVTAPVDDSVS